MNASTTILLLGFHPVVVGKKTFDLVEHLFCKYRVSNYHDEAELATS